MRPNAQLSGDLVTFNEAIRKRKLYFLCSANCQSRTFEKTQVGQNLP